MNKVYIVSAHDEMDHNDPIILAVFSNHDAASEYWAACYAKMEAHGDTVEDESGNSNFDEWLRTNPFRMGKNGCATDFYITEHEVFENVQAHLP
jgi:hypothetical protein